MVVVVCERDEKTKETRNGFGTNMFVGLRTLDPDSLSSIFYYTTSTSTGTGTGTVSIKPFSIVYTYSIQYTLTKHRTKWTFTPAISFVFCLSH